MFLYCILIKSGMLQRYYLKPILSAVLRNCCW